MHQLRLIKIFLLLAGCLSAQPRFAQAQQPPALNGDPAAKAAQALFDSARDNKANWEDVVRAYENFQTQFPQHPDAINAPFNIAEAKIQLGEFKVARDMLRQYYENAPDNRFKASALYRMGECSYFLNEYEDARSDLELFRSQYPGHEKDSYAIGYLGDIYLTEGSMDVAAAKKLFQEGIATYSKPKPKDAKPEVNYPKIVAECQIGLARAHATAGEIPRAISLYQKIFTDEKNPLANDARVRLGKLFYESERYDEAIATLTPFEKSAKSANKNWGLYWLGRTYLDRADETKKDSALAVKSLLAISILKSDWLDEEPPIAAVAYYLGDAYRATGKTKEAVDRYRLVFFDYPESDWADDAFLGAMRVALETGDYERVRGEYLAIAAESFSTSPMFPYMDQLVGQALLKLAKYADAKATFTDLTRQYPEGKLNPDPTDPSGYPLAFTNDNWLYLALSEIGLQRADLAIAALNNIRLTTDPASQAFNLDVRAAKAHANVLEKNYRDAIKPLQEYLSLRSSDVEAPRYYELLALCQIMERQIPQAKNTIEDLGRLDPRAVGGIEQILEAEKNLAIVAAQQKEKELARELYTLLTFPENPRSYIEFGEDGLARLEAGQPPVGGGGSETDAPSSGRAEDKAAFAAFDKAIRDEKAGNLNEALSGFTSIHLDYPKSPEAPKSLLAAGRILDRENKDKEAAAFLQKLVDSYPQFEQQDLALYRLGWTLTESGDVKGGQRAFLEIADNFPDSTLWADAAYRVAEYDSATKRLDDANRRLDEILRVTDTQANPTRLRDHVLYLRGQNAFREGRWTVVEKQMARLLKETPESPLAFSAEYWLAEAAYKSQDWDTAEARFAKLEEQAQGRSEPWLPVIPLRRAQILAWEKKWDAAYQAAADLKNANPQFDRMHEVEYLMGRCLVGRNKLADARKHFSRVVSTDADQRSESAAMSQWMIGETYFRQREYKKAINEYDIVQKNYSDHPYWQSLALLQIGKCYIQLGDQQHAAMAFDSLLNRFPESAYAKTASELRKLALPRSAITRGRGVTLR